MANIAHLRKRAIRLHNRGMRVRDISRELQVPPLAVKNWLPGKSGDDQFETMAAMRARGMTNVEIAEHTGLSRQRVGHVLGAVRKPRQADISTRIRVQREAAEGMIRVAEELGIHPGKRSDKYSQVARLMEDIVAGRIELKWKPGHGPFSYLADIHDSSQ